MKSKFLIFVLLALNAALWFVSCGKDTKPDDVIIHVEAIPIPTIPDSVQETPAPTPQPTIEVKTIHPPDLNIPLNDDLQNYIYEQCGYDDDLYCLMIAVIEKESSFIEDAVSADGHDHGLMQLRDSYYDAWMERYQVSDPTEPYDNVTVGIALLKGYLDKYKYKNLALMCYNCGESGAKKLWKKEKYSTDYTDEVLSNYKSYLSEVKR